MSRRPLVPTGLKLFLFFTVIPLAELLLLVWLTAATSFLFTLGPSFPIRGMGVA